MKIRCFLLSRAFVFRDSYFLLACTAALAVGLATGCGTNGSGSSSTGPVLSGNTAVTLLASSTANDQLSRFNVILTSLTLTNQSGKTVTVFTTPQTAEFIHLNGSVEPLTTVSVPQDVYTSATATLQPSGFPTCVGQEPAGGGLLTNAAIGGYTAPPKITVNLPEPITVTGSGMGLELNLLVSKSVSSFNCVSTTNGAASITPTFNLIPVTIAAQPTNSTNGMATGLRGVIASVSSGGTSFRVAGADGPTWQVNSGTGTLFQGVTEASQLATGMSVDMDVAIQADGSLLAKRVGVYDTNATNLTLASGPLIELASSVPALASLVVENKGPLLAGLEGGSLYFNFTNAVFQTSGQLANVQKLPFSASFKASNMVDGQNFYITTHASTLSGGPTYVPATTITLITQTINGKVTAVSNSGNFTTYTVALASYDLFANLAVQPGQTTLLTNPNTVVVYVDSNTHQLNSDPAAVGSLLRFRGLVFNDNGTLRMDCGQVNDGVKE
ncbi:MAG TPA: hypothetical protein VHX63_00355 [Acidobacteriaceae bacterium]|jgi:hypothetical protein|nr:hypothetical protein [Acidobacteriaceae bacterium]